MSGDGSIEVATKKTPLLLRADSMGTSNTEPVSDSSISTCGTDDSDEGACLLQYQNCAATNSSRRRSCLASSENSRRSLGASSERSSSVSFGSIQLREYERIPGDHPECCIGVPISIGWAFVQQSEISVKRYEKKKMDLFLEDDTALQLKQRKSTGGQGACSGNVRRLGAMQRKRLLMDEFNVPLQEIVEVEKQIKKHKKLLQKQRMAEESGGSGTEADSSETMKKKSSLGRSFKKGLMNKCGLRTPSSFKKQQQQKTTAVYVA
ncbi:MAG: hypothetical protein SGILL_005717 [Bacillariaceae sp.]